MTLPRAHTTEHEIVDRIADGDEEAFEQLFNGYYASLCEFALSYVRAPDVVEEIVQTVFLRIWERRRTWDPTSGVRAYLFASTRNAALDHVRREDVARSSEPDVAELAVAPRQPIELTEQHELAEAINVIVSEMPERRRAIVKMRWLNGIGPSEIARILGISVKGVEAHLARAAIDLRERLAGFRP